MTFKLLADLVKDSKKNNADSSFIAYLEKQRDLDAALIKCPTIHRVWALSKGYKQFERDIQWECLSAFNTRKLLNTGVAPVLSQMRGAAIVQTVTMGKAKLNKAAIAKLSGFDWYTLLKDFPKHANKCNWNKISNHHKHLLIAIHPEFLAYLPELGQD